METSERLARGLGMFSVGLGVVQFLAPRQFSRTIGAGTAPERITVARAVGMRELTAGAGLLTQRRPVAWTWMRVAGDAMDIALLARAMNARGVRRDRITGAMAAVAGVTALDLLGSVVLTRDTRPSNGSRNGHGAMVGSHGPGYPLTQSSGDGAGTVSGNAPARSASGAATQGTRLTGFGGKPTVRKSITIDQPRQDVYAYWRQLSNLPNFMKNVKEVRETGGNRWHWVAEAPLGTKVEWDAEMTEDQPGQLIAWESVEGSQVHNAGRVVFEDAPGDRGTQVTVELRYSPPGGPLGAAVAKLFGEEPSQQIAQDLRRFKSILETGEVLVAEADLPDGSPIERPAQPAAV